MYIMKVHEELVVFIENLLLQRGEQIEVVVVLGRRKGGGHCGYQLSSSGVAALVAELGTR